MQTKLLTAVFLSLALVVTAACSSSSQNAALEEERTAREQAEQEAADERAAREQAEQEAADERAAREQAEQEAADEQAAREQAEQEAVDERAARAQAEAERERLRQEAEMEQQEADRAQAEAAFTALGGSAADGTRTDPGVVVVTPIYGQMANVTAGTLTDEDFESKRRSSSGRWSITTLKNDDSTYEDDLVVYSDIGGPTQVLFTEHSAYSFEPVSNTNNIQAVLTGNGYPIASPQFPRGGNDRSDFDYTIDSDLDNDSDNDGNARNDYDTTRFTGTFAGVPGIFECIEPCTVVHEGGTTYNLSEGTWTFTTGKNARAPVPDDSYMHFGWWKREQKSDGSLSFEMFSDGAHDVDTVAAVLTGTATYTGPAVGQYAIYQPLGTQTASGSFTARATLTADFGSSNEEGTLSGRVTNFGNASDWAVALNSADISSGAVSDGAVSWTIGGNTEDGGMWDAKFFSDMGGSTAYPEGVAGTFDAKFAGVGRLIGAFGAHCPTSTCPR